MLKFCAALFVAIPLTAHAAEPYEGSWAQQTADCGAGADSSFRIAGSRYFGHESECAITKMGQMKGTYALFLACSGEGDTYNDAVLLTPQGNRILVGGPNRGTPMIRCRSSR